jgi:hypothetical protein
MSTAGIVVLAGMNRRPESSSAAGRMRIVLGGGSARIAMSFCPSPLMPITLVLSAGSAGDRA